MSLLDSPGKALISTAYKIKMRNQQPVSPSNSSAWFLFRSLPEAWISQSLAQSQTHLTKRPYSQPSDEMLPAGRFVE